jgi:hypothetical protein
LIAEVIKGKLQTASRESTTRVHDESPRYTRATPGNQLVTVIILKLFLVQCPQYYPNLPHYMRSIYAGLDVPTVTSPEM